MTKNAAERLSNEEKIAAVNYWQNEAYVHPLTCGNDSQKHENLKARKVLLADEAADGTEIKIEDIELYCVNCDYTQGEELIPPVVFSLYTEKDEYEKTLAHFGFKKTARDREIQEGTFLEEDRFNN